MSNVVFKHVIKFWPVFTSFVFEQHSTHKSMLPGSSNVSKRFFDNTYILKKYLIYSYWKPVNFMRRVSGYGLTIDIVVPTMEMMSHEYVIPYSV